MFALVIGGGRGIGAEIARTLADRGHGVAVLSRTTPIDREERPPLPSVLAEVLDPAGLCDAIGQAVDLLGGLDAVVYSVGRFRAMGPIVEVDPASWWLDVETTLRGFANVVRESVPILRRSPSPSLVTLIGPGLAGELANGTGYGLAQAGLARLVESVAVELRPDRIPIYALNPGVVPTGLMNGLLESAEGRRWLPRFTEAFAEGKEVGPEVAAEMAAWLVETRPIELSGRVVNALQTPEILASRLARIVADDSGKLRLR